ncbi:MAG: Planctomycete cytochrome [Phycisphaerales bacterium]|nr:Planctomycete cytochrome [Phycisphaerales bacterium]
MMRLCPVQIVSGVVMLLSVGAPLSSAIGADDKAEASFHRDVTLILSRSCVACHRPEKKKGKLDLTTYADFAKGGKSGPAFVAGDPDKSLVIQSVTGDEPEMPNKGEHLSAAEIEVLSRWIKQGAKDDSPPATRPASDDVAVTGPQPPTEATVYHVAPIIGALACSPDGNTLAVAGSHEVLLHHPDGSGLIARLPSGSPRTTSLVFSPDGKLLAAAGGSPGEFGQIIIWSTSDWKPIKDYRVSGDTLFGISFSPSADRLSVGCADRSVRVIALEDGKQFDRFDQNTDWALCTAFTVDGTKLLSGSRDKSLRLFDVSSHREIQQINEPNDPIVCLARHPKQDVVAVGCEKGSVRFYKVSDPQKCTEEKRDPNRTREFDRQPGTVYAIAYSADGKTIAIASAGEARVYAEDGHRIATCTGQRGGVFAVAFSPDAKRLYTGGFDGQIRVFDAEKGQLVKEFTPVPLH